MTTELIMTSRVVTLRPDDTVAEALALMRQHHIRNLPVVDDAGSFIGLFGVRRLARLLLPQAGRDLNRHSIADLAFLPEDTGRMAKHWKKTAAKPVSEFLEKEKKLQFCTPDTTFPRMLDLFDRSKDSSLPVIVVEGKTRKLAGIVSVWDVLEGLVMRLLTEHETADEPETASRPNRVNNIPDNE